VYSRLVPKTPTAALNQIVILECTDAQRILGSSGSLGLDRPHPRILLNTTSWKVVGHLLHSSALGAYTNGLECLWDYCLRKISSKRAWVTTYFEPLYQIRDVRCTWTISRFTEKTMTISSRMCALYFKKIYLGFDSVLFVGELDSTGINMTQKRIESTIQFSQPNSLTELYSFLGLVNYFRDYIPQHSWVAQPLHSMVSVAAKTKQKQIT